MQILWFFQLFHLLSNQLSFCFSLLVVVFLGFLLVIWCVILFFKILFYILIKINSLFYCYYQTVCIHIVNLCLFWFHLGLRYPSIRIKTQKPKLIDQIIFIYPCIYIIYIYIYIIYVYIYIYMIYMIHI